MPKTDSSFNPDEYAPVADRIALFYAQFPAGRIMTQLVSHTEREIVFRAYVFRSPDENKPAASGWASERIGDGDINTVACLENTETSAVGRALANLGLTASRNRPSREEMQKASRARARAAQRVAGTTVQPLARNPPLRMVRESAGATRYDTLQRRANEVHDFLTLLSEAERRGLRADRCARARQLANTPGVSNALLQRLERAVRHWLELRAPTWAPERD